MRPLRACTDIFQVLTIIFNLIISKSAMFYQRKIIDTVGLERIIEVRIPTSEVNWLREQ